MRGSSEKDSFQYVEESCAHYWVIEAPNGPVSEGVCKLCGEFKLHKNAQDATPYGGEPVVPVERPVEALRALGFHVSDPSKDVSGE